MGSSLLTLFVQGGFAGQLGFWTIFIAHVMFCLSFVVVTIRARLAGMNDTLEQAAPTSTRRHPDLLAGDLPAGPARHPRRRAAQLLAVLRRLHHHQPQLRQRRTFPMYVWGVARVGLPMQVNVVGTLMLVDLPGHRARRGVQRPQAGPGAGLTREVPVRSSEVARFVGRRRRSQVPRRLSTGVPSGSPVRRAGTSRMATISARRPFTAADARRPVSRGSFATAPLAEIKQLLHGVYVPARGRTLRQPGSRGGAVLPQHCVVDRPLCRHRLLDFASSTSRRDARGRLGRRCGDSARDGVLGGKRDLRPDEIMPSRWRPGDHTYPDRVRHRVPARAPPRDRDPRRLPRRSTASAPA